MKEAEFTKMSSKGQVVIPHDIREDMNLKPGTPFAVMEQKDVIILKKIEMPKTKSWAELTKPLKEAARKAGMKESEVPDIVHRFRSKRSKK